MVPFIKPSQLVNSLASVGQLQTSASRLDGVPHFLEDSVRFESSRLVQAGGIVLRLPQELVARAIVLLDRFWTGPEAGSMLEHDARDVAATALYIALKPSGHTVSPRRLLVVFAFLSCVSPNYNRTFDEQDNDPHVDWCLTEAAYESRRDRLFAIEGHMLRVLGYDTHVALSYTICINYLQTLDAFSTPHGPVVARRAFAHLNTALSSPQHLYLTHQPPALATAAIYLAAREVGLKLPETEWWEVFDVDREELGFLVVALQSVEGFAAEQRRIWSEKKTPLTVKDLEMAIAQDGQSTHAEQA